MTSTKINYIQQTFDKINEVTNGRFVTIRGFDDIPHNSSTKDDIDVLVLKQFIPKLTEELHSMGYFHHLDQLQYMYGAEPHIHYENRELDVHFDIVTGLYYRSSNDLGLFINIDNKLTNSMLDNRVKTEAIWQYQPTPEDEIVHLCCHAIFDKRLVKEKYHTRIDELFPNSNKEKLKQLLDISFFRVSDTIYKALENGETQNIYKKYISFIDY